MRVLRGLRVPRRLRRQSMVALLIVLAATGSSLQIIRSAGADGSRPASYVAKSLNECRKAAKSEFRCYASYYAAKSFNEGNPAAFADIKKEYDSDGYVKAECHQLTHVIGRTSYKQFGGLDKAYGVGDAFCWSGFYHGAIEQAIIDLGPEKIQNDTPNICKSFADKRMYSFDHFNCVHGLGHGLMAVASYDLPDSLDMCTALNTGWEKESCFGGVFMENVMVATRGNGTTAYFKDSEPLYPCTFVKSTYKEQCYLMQTSQILQKNGYDFPATFAECAKADQGFVETCYRSLGRDASGSSVSDKDRTIATCRLAPDNIGLHHCMLGAVRDFVSYFHSDKQALELCAGFGGDVEAPCRQDVAQYYRNF